MNDKPIKLCHHGNCNSITVRGNYCLDHQRVNKSIEYRPEYRRLYASKVWKQLRKIILTNNPMCVHCLNDDTITIATDVDHIIDHKGNVKLFYDINNLQSLCHNCHSKKTRATN
jgi:5-methylcytosine-specific restriction protein A